MIDKHWKAIYIKNLFLSIQIAKSLDFGKLKAGSTVFIGRGESNNGIQGFVSNKMSEKKDCITIGMVATKKSFWQQYDFATSQNILVLRDILWNRYNALFICSILNNYVLTKYNYGHPIKLSTFPKEQIMLPIDAIGQLDYNFMNEYIKELMKYKLHEYLDYAAK